MKRIVSGIIIIALFLLPMAGAQGQGAALTEGDFEYSLGDDGSVSISRYLGKAEELVIPQTLGGAPVKALASYAFINNTKLKRVSLPDSLVSIGERAFVGCSALERFLIPAGVTVIGNTAFMWSKLTKFEVAEGNPVYQQIDGVLFDKSTSVLHSYPPKKKGTKYLIPDGTLGIEIGAFQSCGGLKEIGIPETVASIGRNAFSGCGALSTLRIPSGVLSIGTSAFQGTKLNKFVIAPENPVYEQIDDVLFDKVNKTLHSFPPQKAAREYRIPEDTQQIAQYAFAECAKLEHVIYPQGMKGTGNSAFYYTLGLKKLTLPDSIEVIDTYSFYYCKNLKSAPLPDHVTLIGYCAFAGCEKLSDVIIPQGVTTIEGSAFSGCAGLKRLAIPAGVTLIGPEAFKDCKQLTLAVFAGSYAQQYASDNGIPFEVL